MSAVRALTAVLDPVEDAEMFALLHSMHVDEADEWLDDESTTHVPLDHEEAEDWEPPPPPPDEQAAGPSRSHPSGSDDDDNDDDDEGEEGEDDVYDADDDNGEEEGEGEDGDDEGKEEDDGGGHTDGVHAATSAADVFDDSSEEEEEVEVGVDEIAESHPTTSAVSNMDVCVLRAAFPHSQLTKEGSIGWRVQVTEKRGNRTKGTLQIRVSGHWFRLDDRDRILPITQTESIQEPPQLSASPSTPSSSSPSTPTPSASPSPSPSPSPLPSNLRSPSLVLSD